MRTSALSLQWYAVPLEAYVSATFESSESASALVLLTLYNQRTEFAVSQLPDRSFECDYIIKSNMVQVYIDKSCPPAQALPLRILPDYT